MNANGGSATGVAGQMTVIIEQRFAGAAGRPAPGLLVGGVRWEVERLEWRAMGGPWKARLIARARDLAQLWELAALLRCGVTVNDQRGPAWWGYLASVELVNGARRVRVGLEEMANKIAVRYREFSPSMAGGLSLSTEFASDLNSVKTYGEKEAVFSIGQAALAEASLLRARKLAELGQPVKTSHVTTTGEKEAGAGFYAIVEARGWWETLDWKTADEPRGLIFNSASGADQLCGYPNQQRVGQSFVMPADTWKISEVWLRMRRELLPTDGVQVQLCANNAGVPGSVLATSSTVAAASITDGYNWTRFTFAPAASPAAGLCWLVVGRTGAMSSALYYLVSADQGCGYADGQAMVYNGSSWAARNPLADLNFYVVGVEETSEQARRLLGAGRCGQFFSGLRMDLASGMSTRMYRTGYPRGRKVVEDLLTLGTVGGVAMLGRVELGRLVRVLKKPGKETAGVISGVMIGAGGDLRAMDGRALPPSRWPAGQWATLGELGGEVFVEACTWKGGRMEIGE